MKDILQPLIKEFMPFAQKRMGFKKPPRVFLRNDPKNAENPLGKTAFYDPGNMSVTLYITGRHPKDVMRSLSHELVHHAQNCNGQFDNTSDMGEGYAQNDPHLREMERQAYEIGNLCIRDWEDTRKDTIYIQNMNVSIQKEGKNKMSFEDWKNKERATLLSEKWGFSFNLLNESQEEEPVDEGMCQRCMPDPCRCGYMEEGDSDLEEGAASGRAADPSRAQGGDRREDDERKRPMEESEKPDFPDIDGDGDREESISKASKDKKAKEGGKKKEKSDKDLSKVPPQLRKHVKGKMNEAQIRQIIRKLVKEAVAKKAK